MSMHETQQKGLITELQCQLYFSQKGLIVSVPTCQDSRYDMIVDIDGTLIKIQCKTCRLKSKTGITFNTRSCRINCSNKKISQSYNKNDIDYFATFYNDKIYLVPVEICGESTKTLSFKLSVYNECSLISDYEADKIIENIRQSNPNWKGTSLESSQ